MRTCLQFVGPCLSLVCAACAASPRAERDSLPGHWRGSATFRGAQLPLSITFFSWGDSLHAAISSPDLLILDQPLRSVTYDPPRVHFQAEDLGESVLFEGTLRADTIRGTMRLPMLSRGEAVLPEIRFMLARTGAPPTRPYRTQEVAFSNGGAQLSGTLYLPAEPGPHPAVVLLQGSSLNVRDSYRFYADHFARAGVAALIFDKRGSGASTGNYRRATLDDLVADATAAVQLLAGRSDVDSSRIGLWGLSQGAVLAPLVARRARVAFIIAVSGPGVSFGETAAYQDSVRLVRRGFSSRDAAEAARVHRRLTEWIRTGEGEPELQALLQRTADARWRPHTGIPRQLPPADEHAGWYWATRPLDPIGWWRTMRVPMLVIFGEEDDLVPARQSAERIERALQEAGNRDSRVVVFPGGDHMIKHAPRFVGAVDGQAWHWPRQVPGYMDTTTEWLLQQVRRTP